MSKALAGVWFLVAVIYGAFGHTALSNFLDINKEAQKASKYKYMQHRYKRVAADENGVDGENKTFQLGKKFPDVAYGCFDINSAKQMAKAMLEEDEGMQVKARRLGCFGHMIMTTYVKQVDEVRTIDGRMGIYTCHFGSESAYCFTDWQHEKTGVDT